MSILGKSLTEPILVICTAGESADLRYAIGLDCIQAAYVEIGTQRYLVSLPGDAGRVAGIAPKIQRLTPRALGLSGAKASDPSEWTLALALTLGVRQFRVADCFPVATAQRLAAHGIHVTVAGETVFPKRAVKSDAELRQMRNVQQAAVIAMRCAIAMIRETCIDPTDTLRFKGVPLTSEQVKRAILDVLLDHGCMARRAIVACGRAGTIPHAEGHGPLRAHEPIVLDVFPQHRDHGYWGDLARTVCRGTPPPPLRRMYAAVKAAQTRALCAIKPRVRARSVHAAAVHELRRRGLWPPYRDSSDGQALSFATGHGVGLALHEAPRITDLDVHLKAGHVVAIEPGIYRPEVGGVRLEDTVIVTRTGWRYLVPCEKQLAV